MLLVRLGYLESVGMSRTSEEASSGIAEALAELEQILVFGCKSEFRGSLYSHMHRYTTPLKLLVI